jgi:AraC-like DNA-binding protein
MYRYQKTDQIKEHYKNTLPQPPSCPPIQSALTFINKHLFDERLTISWLKAQCSINSKNFAARLRIHLNRYPKDYILHHRIETSKRMLKQTEMTITTTAISVGFNSNSSFANSFKAREDMTPSQWREQN